MLDRLDRLGLGAMDRTAPERSGRAGSTDRPCRHPPACEGVRPATPRPYEGLFGAPSLQAVRAE
jgi:hypothetical protein